MTILANQIGALLNRFSFPAPWSLQSVSFEHPPPPPNLPIFKPSQIFSLLLGYGHVTPLSKAGKCFCIVYAILGIPLTLMLLTALVERLMIPSTYVLDIMTSKFNQLSEFTIRVLHLLFVFSVLLMFFLFIPAAVFDTLEEDWDYMDSIYYCFISLTTIGLGDYIPGDGPNQPYRPLYKVFTTGKSQIFQRFQVKRQNLTASVLQS